MKAILMSDHAKWCALMMNGNKTIEVRKGTVLYKATQKLIDEYGYADIYVYCCKGKQGIFKEKHNGYTLLNQNKWIQSELNGKVIFKFRCYKVEEICNEEYGYSGVDDDESYDWYFTKTLDAEELQEKSCLKRFEIANYLQEEIGCVIHISDLEIFDKPKELSEFDRCILTEDLSHDNIIHIHQRFKITKAPQSFMYIEVE